MVIQVRILVRPKAFGRITTATWYQELSPILSPPFHGVNAGRTTSTNQSHVENGNSSGDNTVLDVFPILSPFFGVRRPGAALVDDLKKGLFVTARDPVIELILSGSSESQFERLRGIERIYHLAFIIHYFSFQKIGRVTQRTLNLRRGNGRK